MCASQKKIFKSQSKLFRIKAFSLIKMWKEDKKEMAICRYFVFLLINWRILRSIILRTNAIYLNTNYPQKYDLLNFETLTLKIQIKDDLRYSKPVNFSLYLDPRATTQEPPGQRSSKTGPAEECRLGREISLPVPAGICCSQSLRSPPNGWGRSPNPSMKLSKGL